MASGGAVTFLGTRMWMGYTVYYFPLLNLLFSFALVGVAGLAWYYLERFGAMPVRLTVRRAQRGAGNTVQ